MRFQADWVCTLFGHSTVVASASMFARRIKRKPRRLPTKTLPDHEPQLGFATWLLVASSARRHSCKCAPVFLTFLIATEGQYRSSSSPELRALLFSWACFS